MIDFKDYTLWSTLALIDRLDQLEYLDLSDPKILEEHQAILAELDKKRD